MIEQKVVGNFGATTHDDLLLITRASNIVEILSDDVNVMRRNKDCADFTALLFSRGNREVADSDLDERVTNVLASIRKG